jgi:HEAT repeat protein
MASPDPELRMRALEASAEMEDDSLLPSVIGGLDDSDLEVRLAAVQALGAIGGTDARIALERAQASSDPEVQSAATEALLDIQFNEDPLSFEA